MSIVTKSVFIVKRWPLSPKILIIDLILNWINTIYERTKLWWYYFLKHDNKFIARILYIYICKSCHYLTHKKWNSSICNVKYLMVYNLIDWSYWSCLTIFLYKRKSFAYIDNIIFVSYNEKLKFCSINIKLNRIASK